MTATLDAPGTTTVRPFVDLVPLDLYKDIHKGIRAALFAAVEHAGAADPADRGARVALATEVHRVAWLLDAHAAHEDRFCQPPLETHAPGLAAVVAEAHPRLEARVAALEVLSDTVADAPTEAARAAVHTLYLELAAFTGEYLLHQDFEERSVMPALAAAMSFDEVLAVNDAIVSSIPPDQMATSLSIMLPAMDVDDRTDLLGGIRAGAPDAVFAGVCALAQRVLAPADWGAVAARLELD